MTNGKNYPFPDTLYVLEGDVELSGKCHELSEEAQITVSAFPTIEDALNASADAFSGNPYRVGVYKFVEEGKVDVLISINKVNQPE